MSWADVIGCMAELVPSVVELIAQCALAAEQSEPPPRTDADNWKCPDASEIARVLGRDSGSADHDMPRGRFNREEKS